MDLTGKVALITGAAGGMGSATMRRLAGLGAIVVGVDVDDANGGRVASELGAPHRYRHLDVGDLAAWTRVIDETVADLGGVDIVHLNAGVMTRPNGVPALDDPITWLTEARYRRIMGVNVDGVVFGVIAVLPALQARGGGSILVTSSMAGVAELPIDPLYALTKHALVGLVRSLAPVLAAQHITINAICPGGIDTGIVPPDLRDRSSHWTPPSFIADAVVRLLESGETGAILMALSDTVGYHHYEFAPYQAPAAAPR